MNDPIRDNSALIDDVRDVREALREYTDDPTMGVTDADWVPTEILYPIYRRWVARYRNRVGWRLRYLSRADFGTVLRRVFPRARRSRQWQRGRGLWGCCHLSGPGSRRLG